MTKLHQGDIASFNLDPAKGTETKKNRPCIVVSNDNYNHFMNTVIIVPISSSNKYKSEDKYLKSPFFVDINFNEIQGTALLQHLRTVDPVVRASKKITSLPSIKMYEIKQVLNEFF